MVYTVGIDPGADGAAALLRDGKHVLELVDFKAAKPKQLEAWRDICEPALWVIEEVHSMPGQGVRSMFSFGRNVGWWWGVLDSLGVPWRTVRPQQWQAGLVPVKRDKRDKPSLEVARRLFPGAEIGAKDGRADAVLMALWAYQNARKGAE